MAMKRRGENRPEYAPYREISRLLRRGEKVSLNPGTGEIRPGGKGRPLHYPRLRVYSGAGASHSWLWFAETLERLGFFDVGFAGETSVAGESGLEGADAFFVSGGDTFAVAGALGEKGGRSMGAFVEKGGTYIGSCAGAYLPLRSSKAPLDRFNFVSARVTNLADHLPEPLQMADKLGTPYGCRFIFHPVRDEVRLCTTGTPPAYGVAEIIAPLYGGPPMEPYDDSVTLAHYAGFTRRTLFLVDPELADRTLTERAAVLMRRHGEGRFFLFGPHVEHPGYPAANRLLADALLFGTAGSRRTGAAKDRERDPYKGPARGGCADTALADLRRSVSNARIAAMSLERRAMSWRIGAKIYEAEKVGAFLDPIWRRLSRDRWNGSYRDDDQGLDRMVEKGRGVEALVKRLSAASAAGDGSEDLAAETFGKLRDLASDFLSIYFQSKCRDFGL